MGKRTWVNFFSRAAWARNGNRVGISFRLVAFLFQSNGLKTALPVLAASLLAAGTWGIVSLLWLTPWSIDFFYERAFLEYAFRDPEVLSRLRLFDRFGLGFYDDELTDISDQHDLEMAAFFDRNFEILRSYPRKNQTPAQLLSTDILRWFLDDQSRAKKYRYYNYPVNPFDGVQKQLPEFFVHVHQIDTPQDARDYVARLGRVGLKFDQLILCLKIRERQRLAPPRSTIDAAIAQAHAFVEGPPGSNALYTSFEAKLARLPLADADKQVLLRAAARQVESTVYPAYHKLIAYLQRLKAKASEGDGVWRLPAGSAYYAQALHHYTTTDLTPEQIHQIGLTEVAAIQSQLRSSLDRLGQPGGSIVNRLHNLAQDKRFLYPDSDAGRVQALTDYRRLVDAARRKTRNLFSTYPAAVPRVERLPPFLEEATTEAYYEPPALGGSRPGVLYVNLRNLDALPRWSMATLVYHEAVPGHHLQVDMQQRLEGVPTFRKVVIFSAYSEGWALYAERLAWEEGESDAYHEVGRLRAELVRAARLVSDTGIHYKRWSRERAIAYTLANTGLSQAAAVAEVERYIALPGQACAYKIGQLQFLKLRARARDALGKQFDLRKFHDAVLRNGAVPLAVLEQEVQRYIERERN